MEIRGNLWVSKSQTGTGFYATIKDGKTDTKLFLSVGFKRGEEPEDGCEIDIGRGFLSCYQTKSGEAKLKLVVMDYTVKQMSEHTPKPTASAPVAPSGKPYPVSIKFEETDGDGKLPF